MKKNEPTYEQVSKRLSDEEIVESYVFRSTLSKAEEATARKEFVKLRRQRLNEMTPEEVIQGKLFQLKALIRKSLRSEDFDPSFSFSNQLKSYVIAIKRKQKTFAEEIDLHPTKLSRMLNNREHPSIGLMYRLEHHSGGIIPATLWFRLHVREQEQVIKNDSAKRAAEVKRVKKTVMLSQSA